jgi:hypothetical protein
MSFVSTDSHKQETHTWLTPLSLVNALGVFDLDPCAYEGHQTAKNLIFPPDDGLCSEWAGRVWLRCAGLRVSRCEQCTFLRYSKSSPSNSPLKSASKTSISALDIIPYA